MDLGLERAGIKIEWQVEIDEYRRSILARHWPSTTRLSDIKDVTGRELKQVDLICGGFPCQDLSVAGSRAGLRGERSGLFFEFARVVSVRKPRWILIENVPGLLSQDKGEAMGQVIETFSELGYGLSWRVLDSQYFGVPQRRRRVYIVGHLGAPCPPEVLFEPESGAGDPPSGGKAGKDVAHALRSSTRGVDEPTGTTYVVGQDTSYAVNGKRGSRFDGESETFVVASALRAADGHHGHSSPRGDGGDNLVVGEAADSGGVREASGVSRPVDVSLSCKCSDAKRYALCGDAVTVNVARWIGERIVSCDRTLDRKASGA